MASQAVVGGTVAAAVLGSSLSAGSAVGAARSTQGTAVAVAQELAKTGVSTTQLFAVIGLLLLFAGALLIGLARRHGLRAAGPRNRTPHMRGRGVPLAA
ncbi:MAG: LPXTG cell wall anchor domain-containing protein [Gemmatimonadaceae bacterium]|nr:LPXTG cell wall anchor domain-containing protein [Gemmatimonadaceae bacterium]